MSLLPFQRWRLFSRWAAERSNHRRLAANTQAAVEFDLPENAHEKLSLFKFRDICEDQGSRKSRNPARNRDRHLPAFRIFHILVSLRWR